MFIQNHNTNLSKDPTALTTKECNCQQNSNCPLAEKFLSECLVYRAQVDRSDINQIKICYVTCEKKKKPKSVITTRQLLLEIKVKKKAQNSQIICRIYKIII